MTSTDIFKSGAPFVWLTGGALAVSVLMIVGLLFLITTQALGFFWPADIVQYQLADGRMVLGQLRKQEQIPQGHSSGHVGARIQLQVGNRDLYPADFRWIDASDISEQTYPEHAVCIERHEWGNFYGFIAEVWHGDEQVTADPQQSLAALQARLPRAQQLTAEIREIETHTLGRINTEIERLRVQRSQLDTAAQTALDSQLVPLETEYRRVQDTLTTLREAAHVERVVLRTVDGRSKELPLAHIVRVYAPNTLSWVAKLNVYSSKVWEFLSQGPRESNTEGGIFPALFGTVMMVMIMSVAVVPFGVMAALYLREYARQGLVVQLVRIAVNNLAGVPSIVFGVFGLGFFVYFLGGSIDALFFPEHLPTPTFGTGGILWASLTLALLTVPVVIVATEEALAAVPKEYREGSLALGATQFETIWRVVLPNALPGILTGLILAMARGAGEVAPLMITGVVKLAPSLPLDWYAPFVHLDRKFMHLGFHIYDVGFQSPNVEAAKPMVYATALLLVGIVISLNLSAILIRNRLRRRLAGSAF